MNLDLIGQVRVPLSEGVCTPPAQAPVRQQLPAVGPQHLPAPSSAMPLIERLHRAWAVGRTAAVSGRDLPATIDELIRHHVHIGFYGDRLVGMRRLTGFGADGNLEVQLAPNRRNVPYATTDSPHSCDLCEPPFPEERGLSWRNWRIWPNAFPYVPAEFEHLLLTRADHVAQGFSSQILGDMIDFQTCATAGRQLTMHYNGIAGNSQTHLHWQACRVTTPLQTEIDSGRMLIQDIARSPCGRFGAFDQGSFCGLLVEGDKSFVLRWADRLVRRLEGDAKTRGAYNMVLLQPRDGRPRLVVFPRRADKLKVKADGYQLGIGGFNAAGIVVVPRAEITPNFAAELGSALRSTMVPPAELPWLEELGKESSVSLPWAQALLPQAA